jgi:hypothetical protein
MRAGGDFKRFPFATPEALGDSGLDFAALAHVKENITVRALLWAPSPQDGAPKTQNVMQITYDAALCSYVPDHEMYSFGRRRAAMTWSSERTSVLLYAILATLLVMSWIYVPA